MGRGPTKEYYKQLNENYVEGTLTCLKPEVLKKQVALDFPNVMNIEVTNRCNLKCVYCPRQKATKGVGDLRWDLYCRLIDEIADHSRLIMLSFHKDGEPFLHPKFIEMTRYARKMNVARTLHVNTNAVTWNDDMIERIFDSGLDDITVSIDAAKASTYKQHKGADILDKVEHQVLRFFEKRSRMNLESPFVRVKIMEFDQISRQELDSFFKKWEDIADDVQVTGIHSWSDAIEGIEVTDERVGERYPCAIMWYSLVINWNGEATVCSVDWNTEINIGNVNHQTIHEIWNSRQLKMARRSQVDGCYDRFAVCKECCVWVSVGDLKEWFVSHTEFYRE